MDYSKELIEGGVITIHGFELTVVSISGGYSCKVRLKSQRLLKHVRLTKEAAVKINDKYAVYIKSVDELCRVVLTIKQLQPVSKFESKALLSIAKFDIQNVHSLIAKAVPIEHTRFTHRCHNWLIHIHSGSVSNIVLMDCTDCMDTEQQLVYDECPHCEGIGCEKCNTSGLRKGSIKCQNVKHLTKGKTIKYNKHSHKQKVKKHESHGIKSRKRGI